MRAVMCRIGILHKSYIIENVLRKWLNIMAIEHVQLARGIYAEAKRQTRDNKAETHQSYE